MCAEVGEQQSGTVQQSRPAHTIVLSRKAQKRNQARAGGRLGAEQVFQDVCRPLPLEWGLAHFLHLTHNSLNSRPYFHTAQGKVQLVLCLGQDQGLAPLPLVGVPLPFLRQGCMKGSTLCQSYVLLSQSTVLLSYEAVL